MSLEPIVPDVLPALYPPVASPPHRAPCGWGLDMLLSS